MTDETPDGFIISSHKSLQEKTLWMGVPRDFFILNATLGTAVGIMQGLYPFLLVTVLLHLIAKRMAKEDEMFFKAIVEHVKLPRFFDVR